MGVVITFVFMDKFIMVLVVVLVIIVTDHESHTYGVVSI
jgi:hypothetical protein